VTTAWHATAALVDPVRRRLYEHVRSQRQPVTRDEAAHAAGVSRGLAAFHLEKLVNVGLLTARYATPPRRPRGPGRSPKVYEPSGAEVSLTIPERRYGLLGDILAEAVAHHPRDARDAARSIARRHGTELGQAVRPAPVLAVLAGLGFEPAEEPNVITLRNCPFHQIAAREPELVCGINQCFLAGLLSSLGDTQYEAVLAPRPDVCCVQLRH
jgi:predicted ArsR family transcriptional regulator